MQFGAIGCGRISQMMHLPHLDELPGTEVAALADPAANVRREVGETYRVPERARFADAGALVDAAGDLGLDAVVVATPPHTHREAATAALDAGLDTLVEKPLALTLEDADALVDAAAGSDATAMVGYMKRHDPTYLRLQERVADLDGSEIRNALGRLVLGRHDAAIEEMYDLVEAELDDAFLEESGRERFEQAVEAVGVEDEAYATYYQSHLGASCHDVSALRGLFGDIETIEFVDVADDLQSLNAYLRFEGGVGCWFTSSFNDRKEWEEYVRIETPGETITLEFTNPYVRNDPFTLHVKRGAEELADDYVRASYEESFKCELERFVACATGEAGDVRTTFREARDDVAFFVEAFDRHLRG